MEDVLINFVGKVDQLVPAEDALSGILEKDKVIGEQWKATSAKMDAATKSNVDNTNKLAKSIDQLAVASKSMDKAVIGGAYKDYLKQIQDQLKLTNKEVIAYIQNAKNAAREKIVSDATDAEVKELTLSIEVMDDQLKQLMATEGATSDKTQSLRARIRETKDELIQMAEAGLQGTPAFAALQKKAGELDDQMRDLNQVVRGLGSDTKNIDGLISLAGGVAGGFALAQGAAALFGDENEEVQKALLKVNAAMSILQGLQQIQIVMQKESAAMLLISEVRTKALALGNQFLAATELETAAASNVLRGALIATGIGAFVVLLGTVANAMGLFGDETKDTTLDMKLLNEEIEFTNKLLDTTLSGIQQQGKIEELRAKRAGASDKELHGIRMTNLFKEKQAEIQTADEIKVRREDLYNKRKITTEGYNKLVNEEVKHREKAIDIESQRELESEQFKLDQHEKGIENRKKADDKATELRKKSIEEQKEERRRQLADDLAAVERKLLTVEKGSQAEIDIQKQIIDKKAAIELNAEGLKQNQIALIKEKALNDQLELQREFNKNFSKLDFEDRIAANNIQLAQVNTTNEEKLRLTIENLESQAQIEIIAAEGNSTKILEINAKRDKQIRDARISSIDTVKAKELEAYAANAHDIIKFNEQIAASDKSSPAQKIAALKNLESIKEEELNIEFEALEKKKGLIDDYDLQYKILQNKRVDLEQDTQDKITAIDQKAIEKRMMLLNGTVEATKRILQEAFNVTLDTSAAKTALTELVNVGQNVFNTLTDKTLDSDEKRAAIITGSIAAGQQVINGIFADASAKRQEELEEELKSLDEQRSRELDNKNITEQQKADIDKKYQDREKQVRLRAWEAEKEAKKEQAVINGALAVTNILATVPKFDFGVATAIMIAAAVASTIAQVAIINRAKPPKFFRGKDKGDYEGLGIVDDGNKREAIYRAATNTIEMSAGPVKERTTWLAMDDIVFPSMDHMYKHFSFPVIPDFVEPMTTSGQSIDYKLLAKEVAKEMKGVIPAAKSMHFEINENGIRKIVKDGSSMTEYKNKRYSIPE